MHVRPAAHNFAMAHFSRRQLISAAGALLFGRRPLEAQDEPTYRTGINVVSVLATVRTKKGEIIRDLAKDEFSITENDRPQTIRYFSQETDLPLTLGLMVDTSMSQRRVMNAERGASSRFLEQILRPKDQIFIMQFDMAVQLKQDLTSSFRKLDDALAFVDTPTRRELEGQFGGGTLLYDAIIAASRDIMQKQTGRKAQILLTDGVDTGSEASLADAIDAAQRADTLVYSILFSDPNAYGIPIFGRRSIPLPGPDGKGVLMRISRETGGGFFEVSKSQTLDQIFDHIQEELRSEYSLGYVSDEPVRNSEFRRIQLTAKRKGLVVQARNRYWAKR
jgi:VWFA-related protein